MPATRLGLSLTGQYQARLEQLTNLGRREARTVWKELDWRHLRGSYEIVLRKLEPLIRQAQLDAVRLTSGYLSAYLSAELGQEMFPPILVRERYVGTSYGGLPLLQSLQSPRAVILTAVRDKKPDPLGQGLRAMLVNVDLDIKASARSSLADAILTDPRIVGWRRAVRGKSCGACLAAAGEELKPDDPLRLHPGCDCVMEPVVEDATDAHPRPTGKELFDQMTRDEQDAALGPKAAAAVRAGTIQLRDLLRINGGFIMQKPAEDVGL